ncbi:MAG: hypothetical protein N3I86_15435, partial [Verrucomicrobiae bacterium]|nr:hypothetical protein [Verrucomicrobiae bacterium]
MDLVQLGFQPLQLPIQHGAFFGRALGTAVKNEALCTFGAGNEFDFQAGPGFLPAVLFEQRGLVRFQLALGRAAQMGRAAGAQPGQIGFAHQAPVHHPPALGLAILGFHLLHHVLERGDIGAVAGKHFVGHRQAFGRDDQTEANLLAIRARVAAVTVGGLLIPPRQALEVGAGQV